LISKRKITGLSVTRTEAPPSAEVAAVIAVLASERWLTSRPILGHVLYSTAVSGNNPSKDFSPKYAILAKIMENEGLF